MKVQIPNELKADLPPTTWGKILTATPVVMAVVATMLAALASSEMTRAQYARSLAAQQQSKAGDQWSFFQAKRLRGAFQRNTAELLQAIVELRPLTATALKTWAQGKPEAEAALSSPAGPQALELLQRGEAPQPSAERPDMTDNAVRIKAALDGLEEIKPDREMALLLAPVSNQALEQALRKARDRAEAYDNAATPLNKLIDTLDSQLGRATPTSGSGPSLYRDFTSARLRYTAQRYEVEARLNQRIANLYELQVRKSNFAAERHHARSQRFFCGMLGAQLGVIISTFSIAARKRNVLWFLAAAAGALAIAFAVYVYLYV